MKNLEHGLLLGLLGLLGLLASGCAAPGSEPAGEGDDAGAGDGDSNDLGDWVGTYFLAQQAFGGIEPGTSYDSAQFGSIQLLEIRADQTATSRYSECWNDGHEEDDGDEIATNYAVELLDDGRLSLLPVDGQPLSFGNGVSTEFLFFSRQPEGCGALESVSSHRTGELRSVWRPGEVCWVQKCAESTIPDAAQVEIDYCGLGDQLEANCE